MTPYGDHDLRELSISLWEFTVFGGFNTRRYTLVHGSFFFVAVSYGV